MALTSFTHTLKSTWKGQAGDSVNTTNARTGDAEDKRVVRIPALANALQIDVAIRKDGLLSFFILATGADLDVGLNDPNVPDATLYLAKDWPLLWRSGCRQDNPLPDDVTALYVTNNANVAAQLDLRVLQDATP